MNNRNNRNNRGSKASTRPEETKVYDKPDQQMIVQVISFGKKQRTAEIKVTVFGNTVTRHVRHQSMYGWIGNSPITKGLKIRYYAMDHM